MTGRYTGPYWSDGKFQESVAFGESDPMDALDALSRLHDTAYAIYKDDRHREAADLIYGDDASILPGAGAAAAAAAVVYGNAATRRAARWASVQFNPIGQAQFVYGELSDVKDRLSGTYLDKEKDDIRTLYKQDPKLKKVLLDEELDPFGIVRPTGEPRNPTRPTRDSNKEHLKKVLDSFRSKFKNRVLPKPPTIHVKAKEDQTQSRAPPRSIPDYGDPQQYILLPNGRHKKRRFARKRVAQLLEPIKPNHRLADLVTSATYRDKERLPPGATYSQHGYDATWNVNNLKMKRNKVKPRL